MQPGVPVGKRLIGWNSCNYQGQSGLYKENGCSCRNSHHGVRYLQAKFEVSRSSVEQR